MRTRVPPALALATAVAILAFPAAAGAAPSASVGLSKCRTGPEPEHRAATYKARMQAVPGTERMAIRFELIERRPGHPARQIHDKKLNAWHRSDSGVVKYTYKQTIRQLGAGGSYRTRVRFRWYDAGGKVIKRATRRSPSCKQPGGPPNLTVTAISFAEGSSSGTTDYTVSIGNTGESPAENFDVTLLVDGAIVDERRVERLEAGESASIELNGPSCKRVRAVVDRDDQVAESIEDDNALRTSCQ